MKKILTLQYSFLLVIFCLPFYLIKVSFFGIPFNVLEILALLVTLFTLNNERGYLIAKIKVLPGIFIFSILFLLLGVSLSIFSNDAKLIGLGILKGWFIVPMLFSFALYTQIKATADIEKIFFSLYLSSATVSIIALGYKLAGLVTYDNRLSAFYLSPNHLGMYLAPGIIFGSYFLIKSFSEKASSKKTLLHSIALLVMLFSLYFTHSYASWVALFFSLGIWLLFTKANRKKLFIGALSLLFLMMIFFVFQKDTAKFDALKNLSSRSSLASRQTIWEVSILLVKENPVFGIGPGNFQSAYLSKQSFFEPYLEWAVPQPHNIFLAFWLQSGIFGLVGFLLLLFFLFKSLLLVIKNNKKNTAIAMPLLIFFLYTVMHGLVDTPYWKNDLSFLFWIATFTTTALYQKISKEDC